MRFAFTPPERPNGSETMKRTKTGHHRPKASKAGQGRRETPGVVSVGLPSGRRKPTEQPHTSPAIQRRKLEAVTGQSMQAKS